MLEACYQKLQRSRLKFKTHRFNRVKPFLICAFRKKGRTIAEVFLKTSELTIFLNIPVIKLSMLVKKSIQVVTVR